MVEKSPKWWRSNRNGGEVTGISARIFDMVDIMRDSIDEANEKMASPLHVRIAIISLVS